MKEDRFGKPVIFPTGVHWNPTDYKSIDQTPYFAYLDKEEDKVRAMQAVAGRDDDYSAAGMDRDAEQD